MQLKYKSMEYDCLIPNGRDNAELTIMSVLNQLYIPKKIILVDNKKHASSISSYIYNIASFKGCDIEYHKVNYKSIARIRYDLLNRSNNNYVLFLDDDVILDRDYVGILLNYLIQSNINTFVQGIRIEINGRQNSEIDINKMNETDSNTQELEYGDTFAFFGNRKIMLETPNWKKILKYLDTKGVAGEDVVMGQYLKKAGYKITGINNAYGYHIADANFSYWNTFLASDQLRKHNFKELNKT